LLDNPTTIQFVLLESTITSITIDRQMAIINVQIGKKIIEDVFLDSGSRINIITEKLKV